MLPSRLKLVDDAILEVGKSPRFKNNPFLTECQHTLGSTFAKDLAMGESPVPEIPEHPFSSRQLLSHLQQGLHSLVSFERQESLAKQMRGVFVFSTLFRSSLVAQANELVPACLK